MRCSQRLTIGIAYELALSNGRSIFDNAIYEGVDCLYKRDRDVFTVINNDGLLRVMTRKGDVSSVSGDYIELKHGASVITEAVKRDACEGLRSVEGGVEEETLAVA